MRLPPEHFQTLSEGRLDFKQASRLGRGVLQRFPWLNIALAETHESSEIWGAPSCKNYSWKQKREPNSISFKGRIHHSFSHYFSIWCSLVMTHDSWLRLLIDTTWHVDFQSHDPAPTPSSIPVLGASAESFDGKSSSDADQTEAE